MGNRDGERPREDANPNSDGADDGFLDPSPFVFFIGVFFVRGLFIDINHLKTNDVDGREEDLEIPVNKVYEMVDISSLTL